MARNARARRNQQILFGLLSLIVVVSMGLALISTPSVAPVVPTATPLPLVTRTPTPTPSPTP
jgi:hypothetical protein